MEIRYNKIILNYLKNVPEKMVDSTAHVKKIWTFFMYVMLNYWYSYMLNYYEYSKSIIQNSEMLQYIYIYMHKHMNQ